MKNIKEWTSLPIPELLTTATCGWKTGRGSLLNRSSCPSDDPISQGTELNWTPGIWLILHQRSQASFIGYLTRSTSGIILLLHQVSYSFYIRRTLYTKHLTSTHLHQTSQTSCIKHLTHSTSAIPHIRHPMQVRRKIAEGKMAVISVVPSGDLSSPIAGKWIALRRDLPHEIMPLSAGRVTNFLGGPTSPPISGVIREKYSPPDLLLSKTGLRGFYSE